MVSKSDYSSVEDNFSFVNVRKGMFVNAIAGVMARKFKMDGDRKTKDTWHIVLKNFFGHAVLLPIYSRSEYLKDVMIDVESYIDESIKVCGDLKTFSDGCSDSCLALLRKTQPLKTQTEPMHEADFKKMIHHGTVLAGALLFISDDYATVDEKNRLIFTSLTFETVH